MLTPEISICIPAYKNAQYLRRLLDSIYGQDFKHFEVVISDDSPDLSVSDLVNQYRGRFALQYFRNEPALGSPANWNAAIRKASGQWIKIMHDDDWFRSSHALAAFAEAAAGHDSDFLFCAYYNCRINEAGGEEEIRPAASRLRALRRQPATLLATNCIGPPSVTLYRNRQPLYFDESLKWLVDIEFYCRYLKGKDFYFLPAPLVNIGIGQEQITRQTQLNPLVEIPEHFRFLDTVGYDALRHLLVYDACWRLFRNLGIRSATEVAAYGYSGPIPAVFISMIGWQRLLPKFALRWGVLSKCYMFLHYITHVGRLPAASGKTPSC